MLSKRCPKKTQPTVDYAPLHIKRAGGIYVCVCIDSPEKGEHTPMQTSNRQLPASEMETQESRVEEILLTP